MSDDDDFQEIPLTQATQQPLKPSDSSRRPSKRPKAAATAAPGKENVPPSRKKRDCSEREELKSKGSYLCDSIESRLLNARSGGDGNITCGFSEESEGSYSCNSVESRLLKSRSGGDGDGNGGFCEESDEDFEQLDVLIRLCSEGEEEPDSDGFRFREQRGSGSEGRGLVRCPLCEIDISDLNDELRQVHTNGCLDRLEADNVLRNGDRECQFPQPFNDGSPVQTHQKVVDVSPVIGWIHSLGLGRYEEAFIREEIDWDTLQRLTEEDLLNIGVTALGPRKRIVHALSELRKGSTHTVDIHTHVPALSELRKQSTHGVEIEADASKATVDETSKLAANKLITDYFPGSVTDRSRGCISSGERKAAEKIQLGSSRKQVVVKNHARSGKLRDLPLWCCIPGTPFRVDAFRYLRRDCSHWFLTHFHLDHYQGLTRSFCHGKIYCSAITARLVNMKIGIPWDRLQILPLNQKINIDGVDVTCLDANHCPGSIIILFEPSNGKAVLHTGDFRFSEEMTSMSVLQMCPIHTLILDTTYCNPQYDFPKQEAVIQFVIDAIQAEAFNPRTLFLIGSYTIGKERLFLEVARVLRKKVYVNAAKLHILECLEFQKEDMQWFTLNEQESHIHVVPMWTLASFKRLKHISNQYAGRFSLIVAFSPTGWTFGKGKKKTPGRRWQQGTIIRYEVPYSEHSSFTELREFVKFVSPVNIIPSVNNHGSESVDTMVRLLSS
ncbi:hypothetical protein VitviT2T_004525 [Vitis vinifera]|uniref:SAM domain-containing protein n=2 Tax=Vitis vinifera TaxID=29760 RepID=D7STZ6_VITVI|eukprot:XP_010648404.1 PREDICTED: uncharacterized protein LOC100256089 isoform X1 [Vitis vinifera]